MFLRHTIFFFCSLSIIFCASYGSAVHAAVRVDDAVLVSAMQQDGKILIGGQFTTYDGISRKSIARINADGTLDVSFNTGTGFDAEVWGITILSSGKILVTGNFWEYNGVEIVGVAVLNQDGSLDTSFNVGNTVGKFVDAAAQQSDGKIIIAGGFTFIGGTSVPGIARLNSNGTLDTTFTPGSGANGYIWSMDVQSDDKILIGGSFTTYNGTTRTGFARLNVDGSLDTTFAGATSGGGMMRAVLVQSDGKILVGGQFTSLNGVTISGVARFNSVGTLDVTFAPSSGADGTVYALSQQSDGKTIATGAISAYDAVDINNNVVRINPDGSYDSSFNNTTSLISTVWTANVTASGNIIFGGEFVIYDTSWVVQDQYILFLNDAGGIVDPASWDDSTDTPLTNSQTLTTTVTPIISLSCNSTTINFGTLTPGTPLTQENTCTVTTNNTTGYTLALNRTNIDATMTHTTTPTNTIPDRTNWNTTTPNATTWQTTDTNLGFTVINSTATKNETWWGTGTSQEDTNNKYAGFPQTSQSIMQHNNYSATATETTIGYKLDAPSSQQAGTYQGTITIQATVSP